MNASSTSGPYYDPYDVEINANPYPVYRRLREEAPLYYNEPHDFYAVSRFDDVERALLDHTTFISGRGAILELIKANIDIPPGVILFEDPPVHTMHRSLLSRVFTPRKVAALEPILRGVNTRVSRPRCMSCVGGSSKMNVPGGICTSLLISSRMVPRAELYIFQSIEQRSTSSNRLSPWKS